MEFINEIFIIVYFNSSFGCYFIKLCRGLVRFGKRFFWYFWINWEWFKYLGDGGGSKW